MELEIQDFEKICQELNEKKTKKMEKPDLKPKPILMKKEKHIILLNPKLEKKLSVNFSPEETNLGTEV